MTFIRSIKTWNRDNKPQSIRRAYGLMTLLTVGVLVGAQHSAEAAPSGSCTDSRYPILEQAGPGNLSWCQSNPSVSRGGFKTTWARIHPSLLPVNRDGKDENGKFIPCESSQLGEHRRVDFYQVTTPPPSDACSADAAYNVSASTAAINFVCVKKIFEEVPFDFYFKPTCGSALVIRGSGVPLCESETPEDVYSWHLEYYPPPVVCNNYHPQSGYAGDFYDPHTPRWSRRTQGVPAFNWGDDYTRYSNGGSGGNNSGGWGSSGSGNHKNGCRNSMSIWFVLYLLFNQNPEIVLQNLDIYGVFTVLLGGQNSCTYDCTRATPPTYTCQNL